MNIHPPVRLRISVIIPHLNQSGALRHCLAALFAGSRQPDDVIVVDNGSNTPPGDICSEFGPVTLLHQPLPGPGLARNMGVLHARGDVLAFIDADCVAHPNWLAVAERRMQDGAVDILGGNVRIAYANPARLTALEAYESVFAYRMDRYIAREGFTGSGNLVMRRCVFDKVGGFKGKDVAEDRDWGQRATGAGYVIRYAPDMVVLHPARPSPAALQAKWDRHLAHDLAQLYSLGARLRWAARSLGIAVSPLAEMPRILSSERITGPRSRVLAFSALVRIRLYRSRRMVQLLAGMDPGFLVQRWNASDAR